jgi:transcriptional regulator with XRE-family HTH domain
VGVKLLEVVAENLRQFRKIANLTQEAVGYKARLHPHYIGRVERAEDNISINTLEKIAKVIKVDPSLFLIPNGWKYELDLKLRDEVGKNAKGK